MKSIQFHEVFDEKIENLGTRQYKLFYLGNLINIERKLIFVNLLLDILERVLDRLVQIESLHVRAQQQIYYLTEKE